MKPKDEKFTAPRYSPSNRSAESPEEIKARIDQGMIFAFSLIHISGYESKQIVEFRPWCRSYQTMG